jgi:hypothetical protein
VKPELSRRIADEKPFTLRASTAPTTTRPEARARRTPTEGSRWAPRPDCAVHESRSAIDGRMRYILASHSSAARPIVLDPGATAINPKPRPDQGALARQLVWQRSRIVTPW